jgi:hypothetical protein
VLALPCLAGTAWAAEQLCPAGDEWRCATEETRWSIGLEAMTELPIDLGVRFWVEFPYRIRASMSVGWLPEAYLDLMNAIVVAAGAYDDGTAEVVAGALSSSFVWRTHVGWRPLETSGFSFEAGYGLVAAGGALRSGDLVAALTGRPAPPGVAGRYEVASILHLIDVELDWTWILLDDQLSLRVGLGFAGTVASATTVEPHAPVQLTSDAAAQLDEVYTGYLFLPVISFAVGYRF